MWRETGNPFIIFTLVNKFVIELVVDCEKTA